MKKGKRNLQRVLSFVLVLLLSVNLMVPAMAADATVYEDDFSTDTIASGKWIKYGIADSGWVIADGVVTSQGYPFPSGRGQKLALNGVVAQDGEIQVDLSLIQGGDTGVLIRSTNIVDAGDGFTGYYVGIGSGFVGIGHSDQAWKGWITKASANVVLGETYTLKVTAYGSEIKVYLDGEEKISLTDSTYGSGSFALRAHCAHAVYDNVKITAQAPKTAESIAVTTLPTKTSYFVGETLSTAGLVVTATYDDGTTGTVSLSDLTFDYDFSAAGDSVPVTVSYGELTTSFYVTVSAGLSFPYHDDFEDAGKFASNWKQHSNGAPWVLEDGKLKATSEVGGMKLELVGGLTVTDFVMETDICYEGGGGVEVGVIFRASEITANTDKFKGYYAYISDGGVGLGSFNNAWGGYIKEAPANVQIGETYRLKVVCVGSNIKIYLDGELMVNVNDTKFSSGAVGYRAHMALATYDNLMVSNDPNYVDEVVYKNILEEVYNKYKDLDLTGYPEDRWDAYYEAIRQAEQVLADEDATQAEVDAAKRALQLAVANLSADPAVSGANHLNPLFGGYGADPGVIQYGDTYYIYANTTDRDWCDTPMVYWSDDLVNWNGQALEFLVDEESYGGEYTHRMQWAPSPFYWNGVYYLYFTVYDSRAGLTDTERENNIVAVADNPLGPYTIKDCITYGADGSASPANSTHDPHVFYDKATDKIYILYGGIYEKLFIEELDKDDPTKTVPGTQAVLLWGGLGGNGSANPGDWATEGNGHQEFGEGAYIYTRDWVDEDGETFTRYYLTYSCENYSNTSYKVRYAYSDTGIMGPYYYLPDATEYYSDEPSNMVIRTSPVKTTDGYYVANGPGHHSILSVEVNGEIQDYIVYHKLSSESGTGRVHRQVCIDRIYYTEDGLIKEVVPTYDGAGVDAIGDAVRKPTITDENTVVTASSVSDNTSYPFRTPACAIDGNYATEWQAAAAPKASDPDSAEWLMVDLGVEKEIGSIKSEFWLPHRVHKYYIETSLDGENWTMYADRRDNELAAFMVDEGCAVARYVRITITDMERYYDDSEDVHMKTGLWEFSIYAPDEEPEAALIAEGYTGDLTWKLDETGKLTFEVLNEVGRMKKYGAKNEVPWFGYMDQITTVEIPEGVTRISAYTFYGAANLTSVVVPSTVTEISEYAFKNSGLTSVTLNSGLATIGDSAFYGTGITSVVIPKSVATVGEYAFARCANLTEVTFTGNAPAIGTGAFNKVVATVYYPADDASWTEDVKQNYGGTLTWTAE